MNFNSLYEGYPSNDLVIPIEGVFVGANLNYSLISRSREPEEFSQQNNKLKLEDLSEPKAD